jgi:hypothetical protein
LSEGVGAHRVTSKVAKGHEAAPGFHERVARLQEVLDDFEPRTLKVVSER